MLAEFIAAILSNFDLVMFILALFFICLHFCIRGHHLSQAEVVYRWMALFALGCTGLYAAFMHAVFPIYTAAGIGWASSPFQFEVAMANLAFGILGILSFKANYGFRLATVVGSSIWLWGDAVGHLYQLIRYQNDSIGNAGSWFWMDMLLPLILIACILKLRPKKMIFAAKRY